MNEPSNKINLTTQERRIVMGIFLVVIFVLNYLFVWPHFGEWGKTRTQLERMYNTMSNWNGEIQRDIEPKDGFKTQLSRLERQQGTTVNMGEQVHLQETIRQQAVRTGVTVNNYTPVGSHGTSNEFFEEQSTQITLESQEPQLIDFLYNIGNDPAMVRVAELSLKPADANRYRLQGTVTLTASYAKRTVGATPAAAKKTSPAPRQIPPPAANRGPKAPNIPGRSPFPSPGKPGPRFPSLPGQRPLPNKPRLPFNQRNGA